MIKRIMSVLLCTVLTVGVVGCSKTREDMVTENNKQANVESNVIDDGNIGKSNSSDLDDIPQVSGDGQLSNE